MSCRTAARTLRPRQRNRLALLVERLEERTLLSVEPLTLADPNAWSLTGMKDSSLPSLSADGQLVAFQSNADNLVPNDVNGRPDIFIYNRSTATVSLVSVGNAGIAGGGTNPVISPDGRYVVFESNTRGILPAFTNDANNQLFLRDLATGTTSLLTASATAPNTGGNRNAIHALFSADSRHVGFLSNSSNLSTGVTFTNAFLDRINLFERDLTTKITSLVSISQDGKTDENGDKNVDSKYSLSADGRFVAFASNADNLAGQKYNQVHALELFVRDMQTGVTTQASVNRDGTGGANNAALLSQPGQSLSADGRFVVFNSSATDLVPGTVSGTNVYLRDLRTGVTKLISTGPSGAGSAAIPGEIISPNGRYVAFQSPFRLLPLDINNKSDVYVYDTTTQTLSLASINTAATNGGNGDSGFTTGIDGQHGGLVFSADSASLVFKSFATNLVSGVATSKGNLYVRNLATGQITLLTPSQASTDGGDGDASAVPSLSADGRYVAFDSAAGNLVPGDKNGVLDVFLRDVTANHPVAVSLHSPQLPAYDIAAQGGILGNSSTDGRYVVFASIIKNNKTDLVPGLVVSSTGGGYGVYVRDRQTGSIRVVDLLPDGQESGSVVSNPQDSTPLITADGRYVLFQSRSTALVSGITYTTNATNLFLRDLQTQTTRIISVDPTGTHDIPVPTDTQYAISDNGRYVCFTTNIAAPYAGVSNSNTSRAYVFIRDLGDGATSPTTVLISQGVAGDGVIRGDSRDISMSRDGRYVLYRSNDPTIAAGDGNNNYDVFRWDRTTAQNSLVSINQAGTGAGERGSSVNYAPSMTPDGRFVTFASTAYDLVGGMNLASGSRFSSVFLRDMSEGTNPPSTTVVLNGFARSKNAWGPVISDSGDIASISTTEITVPNNPNPITVQAIFLNGNVLVAGNQDSDGFQQNTSIANKAPVISPDGRYVAFWSRATNLVTGFVDGNGTNGDLYVVDSQTGVTRLVTYNESGTESASAGETYDHVRFSRDSGTFFFDSVSGDLIQGDRNNTVGVSARDVFAFPLVAVSSISGQVFNDANNNGVQDGESGLAYRSVFLDANGNGKHDPGEVRVDTDDLGRFSFQNVSPGTYAVTLVPQSGFEQTLPASSGSYPVTITAVASVLTGKDFGAYQPLPDLRASNVAFTPSSVLPGQSATITWTVANQGPANASGSWQDAVYLSATPSLGADARMLATVPHVAGLAVGQSYQGNATVALPANSGTWYVLVVTDRREQVVEGEHGGNRANNTAVSTSMLTVNFPILSLSTPAQDVLSVAGADRYFKLDVPVGHSLVLTLSSAASAGQLELYVRRGGIPTTYDFDFASRVSGQPGQLVTVPQFEPGEYFVLVHGVSGAALTSQFTLTATEPGQTLSKLGLATAGNGGRVTIPVLGTDLTSNTPITLTLGSVTLNPVAIDFRDASLLYATFDLAGQAPGAWTLHVGSGSQSAPFEVKAARGPNLQVHLAAPSAVRTNHPGADLLVDFENTGDTDMPAPVFVMQVAGHPEGKWAFLQVLFNDQALSNAKSDTVQFIGQGADSPGGVLRAGDKGQVKVRLTFNYVSAGGGPYLEVTLKTMAVDTTPIGWDTLKAQLQPPAVPNDAWDVVYTNFTSSVGATTGQLQSSVVADTAYLNQIGVSNPTFADIMAFEMLRADAALPTPTLASEVDASYPTPGLALSFGRSFYQSISGRYHLGTLGRGWVSNWDISATTDANGDVLIQSGGAKALFTLNSDGSYGEDDQLAVVNGTLRLIDGGGNKIVFRSDGLASYIQDPNGNRITLGYNNSKQLTSLSHSNGKSLIISYNAQGRVQTVTDPANRVATYAYDASGEHLLSVTTVDGTMQYGYVSGQGAAREHALASVLNPTGVQSNFTYDAQGRLTGSFLGTAASPIDPVAISYTSPGGVTFSSAAGSTTVLYNQFGQPAVVVDPLGNTVSATYDADHNLTRVDLPGGLSYGYTFDVHGNLTSTTDPLGQRTQFTYDATFSNLTSFTDALGRTTRYNHDGDGNLLSITYPGGSKQSFSYDPLGNLIESVNRRGRAVDYAYNTAGQVTKITFADASHLDYTYDSRGNLLTAIDASGTIAFEYDSADRLTKVTYPGGRFLQFTYNAGGQRVQSIDQTGYTINYAYDAAGRLSRLSDGADATIVQYTYDAAGRLVEKLNGNGTYTTYAYDAAGQVLSIVNRQPRPAPDQDGPINSRFDYTYDALGRVTQQSNSDGIWTYAYDPTGQLTHAVFASSNTAVLPNQDLQYFYDAVGNRTKTIINDVTTNYTVNDQNEYTQVGTDNYTYDSDGNVQTKTDASGTTTYTFDDLNRLVSVSSPTGTFSYTYDAIGNLGSTTTGGVATSLLNDPTGFGNITGLGTVTAEFNGASAFAHYAWGLGLVGRTDANGPAFYDFDLVGSTAGITNSAGAYVNRYSYLPFGESATILASLSNLLTYGGQFGTISSDYSLTHMGRRFYLATEGQFVSNDPMGLRAGDANLRRFVGNSPSNLADPSGLCSITIGPSGGNFLGFGFSLTFNGDGSIYFNKSFGETTKGLTLASYSTGNAAEGFSSPGSIGPAIPGKNWMAPTISSDFAKGKPNWDMNLNFGFDPDGHSFMPQFTDRWFGPGEGSAAWGDWYGFICPEDAGKWAAAHSPIPLRLNPNDFWVQALVIILGAGDPNELIGPGGFGTPNYVGTQQALPYTVFFENDPHIANAAAQDVVVTQQLDADLDWSTFAFGSFEFGSTKVAVPAGLQSFDTTLSLTNIDGTPLRLDIKLRFNRDTGVATWTFLSLDPVTGQWPENPVAGFLPVNDDTHRGEGQVRYSVQAKAGLAHGTTIDAQASIVFDTNSPIATNAVANTIDARKPTVAMAPLPTLSTSNSVPVSWSGADESGIRFFDVYVSTNGGAYVMWQNHTAATAATFAGARGSRYAFYAIAFDNVGNVSAAPTAAQAAVVVASNSLTLRKSPTTAELQVYDNVQHTVVYTQLLSSTAPVAIRGLGTFNDTVTLDFVSGGAFVAKGAINLDSGLGSDAFRVQGTPTTVASFTTGLASNSGVFNVGGTIVHLANVESAFVSNLASLTFATRSGSDVLSVIRSAAGQSRVAGTSGGIAFAPLTWTNVSAFTLNTGLGDSAASVDRVTVGAGGLSATKLKSFVVTTGLGSDRLQLPSSALTLPVAGGSLSFVGGAGTDTLVVSGNANYSLTNSKLSVSPGGSVRLSGVERAILQGGASANRIDASAFTGSTILDGGAGSDTLVAGAGRSILIGGLGADVLRGGGADDLLIGGKMTYNALDAAFQSIADEWFRTAPYATRIAHLKTGGGLNGASRVTGTTAPKDNAADRIHGGAGLDWFWADLPQDLLDDRSTTTERVK